MSSGGEWFRAASIDYPEFSRRMPTLRPSSKNVLSIKREEVPIESPVAAIINDSSTGSSNADDCFPSGHRFSLATSDTVGNSLIGNLSSPEMLLARQCCSSESTILTSRNYIKQRHKGLERSVIEGEGKGLSHPSGVETMRQSSYGTTSPVIYTPSITTGGEFR